MPYFIKESLIYRICVCIVKRVIGLYGNSGLKRLVCAIAGCYGASKTAFVIKKYVEKKPYFLNSCFYRVIKWCAGIVDKLLGFIHNAVAPVVKGSLAVREGDALLKLSRYEKISMIAVFIAAIEFGFCVGSFFAGTLSKVDMIYIIGPVVVCMLMLGARKIYFVYRYSFLCKIIKFLFD